MAEIERVNIAMLEAHCLSLIEDDVGGYQSSEDESPAVAPPNSEDESSVRPKWPISPN